MIQSEFDWNKTDIGNYTRNETEYQGGILYYSVTNNAELVLFILFLLVWTGSILVFFFRWNTVRLMQPVGTRYCYMPRNLHKVQVVKDVEESVIYCK